MGKERQVKNHHRHHQQSFAALGAAPLWVWHPSYAALHPPADPLSLAEGENEDNEQTYRQFMDLAKREPNERGTGRWKISRPDRQTIAIVALDAGVSTRLLNQVRAYLQAFFHGLPVEQIHNNDNAANQKKVSSTPSLITHTKQDKWYFQTNKQPKSQQLELETCQIIDNDDDGDDGENDKKVNTAMEVFSLFDAMVPTLVLDHYYCVIGLTSHHLAEQWTEEKTDGTVTTRCDAVLGRACGDRVCVVQAQGNVLTNTLLATCTHELLHCFGFDHCTTFHCLMNSQSIQGEDCLFLSPLNLKKWVWGVVVPNYNDSASQHDNKPNKKPLIGNKQKEAVAKDYVLDRYRATRAVLSSFGLKTEVHWLDRKIAAVQDVYTKKEAAPAKTAKKPVTKRKAAPTNWENKRCFKM